MDNNFDLRILRSYLVQYFSDDTLGKQQTIIDNEIAVPLSKNLRVCIKMFEFFHLCLPVSSPTPMPIISSLGLYCGCAPFT